VGGRAIPGATGGAVVTGTVSGLSLAEAPQDRVTTLATPVTVSVVGTNISTTVDGSGRFQLTGVPTGDVQLKFVSTGLDATLTLRDVQSGDLIDVRVRVTGSSVRIEAERRVRGRDDDDDDDDDDEDDEDERDDRDDDEIEGVVSGLTGTCPDITFTVNRLTVRATSATRFDGTCARVRNNARVEVR
jgi:hypothetical protein